MWEFFSVNLWAVLIAGAASMVVGFVWFSPMLFLNAWIRARGFDPNDRKFMDAMLKKQKPAFPFMFVLALVSSYLIAILFANMGVISAWDGIMLVFWLWLALVVPVVAGNVLASGQKKSLIWIEIGHILVGLVVVAAILGTWA